METVPNPAVLQEIRDSRVPFTNFSIEEILKPDFGRRQLTTGVLNLTVRRSHAHENGRSNHESGNKRKTGHSVVTKCSSVNDNTSLSAGSDGEGSNSSCSSSPSTSPQSSPQCNPENKKLWPAWVYCTRYSDRPSSGPRSRKIHRKSNKGTDDKRPRTAFSTDQLRILKQEFDTNRYLTESRRQNLARELNLNESQIKIWFQNKRAKNKKTSGEKNTLALELMAQGLYNHRTCDRQEVPVKMEV